MGDTGGAGSGPGGGSGTGPGRLLSLLLFASIALLASAAVLTVVIPW